MFFSCSVVYICVHYGWWIRKVLVILPLFIQMLDENWRGFWGSPNKWKKGHAYIGGHTYTAAQTLQGVSTWNVRQAQLRPNAAQYLSTVQRAATKCFGLCAVFHFAARRNVAGNVRAGLTTLQYKISTV